MKWGFTHHCLLINTWRVRILEHWSWSIYCQHTGRYWKSITHFNTNSYWKRHINFTIHNGTPIRNLQVLCFRMESFLKDPVRLKSYLSFLRKVIVTNIWWWPCIYVFFDFSFQTMNGNSNYPQSLDMKSCLPGSIFSREWVGCGITILKRTVYNILDIKENDSYTKLFNK